MRRLLVTADDFGLDLPTNRGIALAADAGAVRSASVLALGARLAEAVDLARQRPELELGLHVQLVQGRPRLPPDRIATLVLSDGCFPASVFALAARVLDPRHVLAEATAQFDAFEAAFGHGPAFINTHQHTHLLPQVLGPLIALCRARGIPAMRLPAEHHAFRPTRHIRTWAWPGATLVARGLVSPALRLAGIRHPDRMLGGPESGRLDRDRLHALLRSLPAGSTELVIHPAAGSADWHALLDSQTETLLLQQNVSRIQFRDL